MRICVVTVILVFFLALSSFSQTPDKEKIQQIINPADWNIATIYGGQPDTKYFSTEEKISLPSKIRD